MINNININPLVRLPHIDKPLAAVETNPATIPDSSNTGEGRMSVRVKISDEAKNIAAAFLEIIKSENVQKSELEHLFERLRDSQKMHDEVMKGIAEQMSKQRKALMIARRIAAGEDVPAHERQFLMGQATILYIDAYLERLHRENKSDSEN